MVPARPAPLRRRPRLGRASNRSGDGAHLPVRSAPGLKTGAGREGTGETEEGAGRAREAERGRGRRKVQKGRRAGVPGGLSLERTLEARGRGVEGTKETQGRPGRGRGSLGSGRREGTREADACWGRGVVCFCGELTLTGEGWPDPRPGVSPARCGRGGVPGFFPSLQGSPRPLGFWLLRERLGPRVSEGSHVRSF